MAPRFLATLGLLLLAPLTLAADVIVLKSGRRIETWKVEERGDRVYYETPEGEMGIPKRLVERIERSDTIPGWTSGSGGSASGAASLPEVKLPGQEDPDVQRVVEGGEIKRDILTQLDREAEQTGSEAARHRAVAAHVVAARALTKRNDLNGATDVLSRALTFAPNDPALLLELAAVAFLQQRYAAALDTLRPVLDDPAYAFDAYRLQGAIYYQREEMDRAIAAWKRALELHYDSDLEEALEKAEREAQAVERYQDRASGRFILRYEGGELASQRMAANILETLDSMYDKLASDFNVLPREAFVVLLYPNETFYALTGMPPQVHGLFDGKIRVPLQGVSTLTPALAQVLRHELTHAFLYLKTRNRAPRWLHEGLAQSYAEQSLQISREEFRPLFERDAEGRALGAIESLFGGDLDQMMVAYSASLLVVETLERRYGRGDMEQFLEALARGESLEEALDTAFRLTLVDLERDVYDTIR